MWDLRLAWQTALDGRGTTGYWVQVREGSEVFSRRQRMGQGVLSNILRVMVPRLPEPASPGGLEEREKVL